MTDSNNISSPAATLAKSRLYLNCYKHMQSDELNLPTIPDVSFKIRRAINDEGASNSKIARVVQIDPSITARLIQIANSPFYHGRRKIESCPEALTRMGLNAAQDIITAFALKSVFKAKSPIIRKKMNSLWEHSSYVAAISAVIAHKTPGFDPDRAMLAGLIHDIGIVPILTYADEEPEILESPTDLQEAIDELSVDIGIQIINQWDFPSDFADVIINAENWTRKGEDKPDYSDIVIIAQLHSFIGKTELSKLPKMDELPAYQKLISSSLNIDKSISILDQAKDEINHIRQLLR
ncbi:MAG: HDOD domain-containing protein [Methylococcales bacterium]|nr:HDOD domain-containing protein [Methylococcales bacterium]